MKTFLFLTAVFLNAGALSAQSVRISLEPVISGLSQPVYITNAHDGTNRRFIVEQTGIISVMLPGSSTRTTFLDIRSRLVTGGERGLLGLAFHPQFATNRRFFVDYTRQSDGATVIAEYRASASNPNVADNAELILMTIAQPYENHNGGMVEFGPDGYLYIGMGDGGSGNDPQIRAQNVNELLGKILRIDVDSASPPSPPSTNPYAGAIPGRDEIFAIGLRNPWRFSFDRASGKLYVGDVGQDVREEVDVVTLGGNYGWRVLEGTRCTNLGPASCSTPGFTPPITEYDHINGRCSITGGYVYRGSRQALPNGAYVFGDYCTGEIFLYQAGVQSVLLDTSMLISSFGEDESGEMYVIDHGAGAIYRLNNPDAVTTSARSFSIPSHGGISWSSVGLPTQTTGYARIQAQQRLPGAMTIFGNRQNGTLISEASVPAAPLISAGRIYAEINSTVNTGIAIANPNSQPVTVEFYFTDSKGNNFAQGATTIAANRQIARFLNEDPFNATGDIQGTFTFTTSLLVSAIALRGVTNERSEFLLTTLPVAEVKTAPTGGVLTAPQFANGGGWTTSIVMVNTSDAPMTGQLTAFAQNGQTLAITLNGVASATFSYSIAARSAIAFQSSGVGAGVQVGSISIAANASSETPNAFAIVRYGSGGIRISEASVPATAGSATQSMFVEALGDFRGTPGSIQSGIALSNTTSLATGVQIELYRLDGSLFGLTTISLNPHSQISLFLDEIPGLPAIPKPFQGILRVAGNVNLAVAALRARYNERQEFLMSTTAPIAEVYLPTSSEMLFPHFVIGGGYEMQFVLFTDAGSIGTIYFFDRDGNPLALPLR